jgi:hypothetical protein
MTAQAALSTLGKVKYLKDGRRSNNVKYFCVIKNFETSESYIVRGEFVPNRLTSDMNANSRIEILRCKMENGREAQSTFIKSRSSSNAKLFVKILRGKTSLISFNVPWSTRMNGKTVIGPKSSSKFDAWKGLNESSDLTIPIVPADKLYLSIPGLDFPVSRRSIAIYLEFVQHHLLLGVQHIFLTTAFGWKSKTMKILLRVFQSYIDEGSVTVVSHIVDDIDETFSIKGISFHRDTLKILQVNMHMYLSKGLADYVGVWDVDEFFIPKGKHKTILDVIKSTYENEPKLEKLKANQGYADNGLHPYCYIMLNTEVMANREEMLQGSGSIKSLWMGEQFSHGVEPTSSSKRKLFSFKKSIIPTRTIFYASLHMHGACKLEPKYNGCLLENGEQNENLSLKRTEFCFHNRERIVELAGTESVVLNRNTRRISTETEGSIYHFLIYRYYHTIHNSTVLETTNDYTKNYFQPTKQALKQRNLDLIFDTPTTSQVIETPLYYQNWLDYTHVWNSKHIVGSLFPGTNSFSRKKRRKV